MGLFKARVPVSSGSPQFFMVTKFKILPAVLQEQYKNPCLYSLSILASPVLSAASSVPLLASVTSSFAGLACRA